MYTCTPMICLRWLKRVPTGGAEADGGVDEVAVVSAGRVEGNDVDEVLAGGKRDDEIGAVEAACAGVIGDILRPADGADDAFDGDPAGVKGRAESPVEATSGASGSGAWPQDAKVRRGEHRIDVARPGDGIDRDDVAGSQVLAAAGRENPRRCRRWNP